MRKEIVGIVISHDKQTNVKPQSANANVNSNVAYSLRNTFKKRNNVVNRKHSPSSLSSTKHPKSYNIRAIILLNSKGIRVNKNSLIKKVLLIFQVKRSCHH